MYTDVGVFRYKKEAFSVDPIVFFFFCIFKESIIVCVTGSHVLSVYRCELRF